MAISLTCIVRWNFTSFTLFFYDLSIKICIKNFYNIGMPALGENVNLCKKAVKAFTAIGCSLSCPQYLNSHLLFRLQINSKFYSIYKNIILEKVNKNWNQIDWLIRFWIKLSKPIVYTSVKLTLHIALIQLFWQVNIYYQVFDVYFYPVHYLSSTQVQALDGNWNSNMSFLIPFGHFKIDLRSIFLFQPWLN